MHLFLKATYTRGRDRARGISHLISLLDFSMDKRLIVDRNVLISRLVSGYESKAAVSRSVFIQQL